MSAGAGRQQRPGVRGCYTPATINTCRLWGTDWTTTTTDTETERNVFQAPRRSPVSYDQPLQITWPGPMRTFTDDGLTSSSAAVNTDSNQHRRLHRFFFSFVHVVTHGQSLSFTHACIYKHFSSTDTISTQVSIRKEKKKWNKKSSTRRFHRTVESLSVSVAFKALLQEHVVSNFIPG